MVATAVMSGAMRIAQATGMLGSPPPREITERAAGGERTAGRAKASQRASRTRRSALSVLAHLTFGSTMGIAFAALRKTRAGRAPGPLAGVVFGFGVWAVSYQVALPALRLMPPASRERPGRNASMLLAHAVYGATLGALADGERR